MIKNTHFNALLAGASLAILFSSPSLASDDDIYNSHLSNYMQTEPTSRAYEEREAAAAKDREAEGRAAEGRAAKDREAEGREAEARAAKDREADRKAFAEVEQNNQPISSGLYVPDPGNYMQSTADNVEEDNFVVSADQQQHQEFLAYAESVSREIREEDFFQHKVARDEAEARAQAALAKKHKADAARSELDLRAQEAKTLLANCLSARSQAMLAKSGVSEADERVELARRLEAATSEETAAHARLDTAVAEHQAAELAVREAQAALRAAKEAQSPNKEELLKTAVETLRAARATEVVRKAKTTKMLAEVENAKQRTTQVREALWNKTSYREAYCTIS